MSFNEVDSILDPAVRRFFLWSLKAIGLDVACGDDQVYSLRIPEDRRPLLGGAEQLKFAFEPVQAGADVEMISARSRLFRWMLDQLRTSARPLDAVPAGQPESVHELSQPLFNAYTVDGGSVHLSGCTLGDRPVLRLTFLAPDGEDEVPAGVHHLFADPRGELLSDELCQSLGLADLLPMESPPGRFSPEDLERWVAAGRSLYRRPTPESDATAPEPAAVTVVWCKYAEGKLAFSLGNRTVHLAFEGWSRLLVDGRLKPPPFTCTETGRQSYHLATTDGGQVTVAEAIQACAESGQRVLETDLERCVATDQLVLPEHLTVCPVSDAHVLRSALTACPSCRQQVSPHVIEDQQCAACRDLQPLAKNDPRLGRLLAAFPKLDRWRSWRIAETSRVLILSATGYARRLFLVVDQEELRVLRLAKGTRFGREWTDVAPAERDELLR